MAYDRPIGLHLQRRPNLLRAADRAVVVGATAVQIFADNPAAWRRRAAPPRNLDQFLERLRAGGVTTLAIHGPYLLNLATADETIWQRTVTTIAHELRVGARYGAVAVNVHIGSHVGGGLEAGLRRVGAGIRSALELAGEPANDHRSRPLLVLENSAGGGDGIGGTIEELADVLDATAGAGADAGRIAFCLDTAHLWGAGYDLRDQAGLDGVLERFDRLLGLDRLALVHLNDSRARLGGHADRHEHIGAGEIGPNGMAAVLRDPRLVRVPMVVETDPRGDLDHLDQERIRRLLAGELDLPPLPDRLHPPRRRGPARRRSGAAKGTSGL